MRVAIGVLLAIMASGCGGSRTGPAVGEVMVLYDPAYPHVGGLRSVPGGDYAQTALDVGVRAVVLGSGDAVQVEGGLPMTQVRIASGPQSGAVVFVPTGNLRPLPGPLVERR